MADRFPSIEDISGGQTEVKGAPGIDGVETDSDFLARERAALGDDAAQFATAEDSEATPAAAADEGAGDLLGGGDSDDAVVVDTADFESSFPAVTNGNERVGPGGSITGTQSTAAAFSSYTAPEEEPEVIKQWRERRDLALQHRAEVAAERKEKTVKAAQQAIDDFYENYNSKKEKSLVQTRKDADEFMASREDTSAGGTSWERIGKLVDLSGKGARGGAAGTGKERFRELLTSLRKDEKAPGAMGV